VDISIFYSSEQHPIYPYLLRWKERNKNLHKILLTNVKSELLGGDILFLIASNEIISKDTRLRFKKTLCIHESDLPMGRGWSPAVHLILEGESIIPISLFEAEDKIDSGDIWKKDIIKIEPHELFNEINDKISTKTIELINNAIDKFDSIKPEPQRGEPTYYPKRHPGDSELDVNKSIKDQFNLLRISDVNRYPCFFYLNGYRYKISISKF